jgi:hypothetical protein
MARECRILNIKQISGRCRKQLLRAINQPVDVFRDTVWL